MRALLAAAAVGCALALAPCAAAHAFLVRSDPAAGSVVAKAPPQLVLDFDEGVTPARITVSREGGGAVATGAPHVPPGKPSRIVVPLPQLAPGGYVVRWSEVDDDDGHQISGAFGFAVGSGRTAPSVTSSSGSSLNGGDAVARWLLLSGVLVAAGLAVFRRAVLRRHEARLVGAGVAALLLTAVGATVLLALQPSALTTRFDRITFAGAIAAAVAAAVTALSLSLPWLALAADGAAVVLLALPTWDGHAVAPGPSHVLSVPSDLLHLLAAATWIGGVLGLLLVAAPQRREATRRFAPLALAAVVVLAVTGVLRALSELRSVSQLWTTGYGVAILVKSGLFLALIAAAAAARGRPGRRALGGEAAVLAVLVAVVAVLTGLRPGRDAPVAEAAPAPSGPAFVTAAEAGPYAVGVALRRAGGGGVSARVTVLEPNGPASGLRVTVLAGGASSDASACGAGCYAATLSVPKPTDLGVVVRKGSRTWPASLASPSVWPAPPAGAIVRRAGRAFDALRTLVFRSRLSTEPGQVSTTIWKVVAPDRLSGIERESGSGVVIIGAHRWDRDSASAQWVESPQAPLRQPQRSWSPTVRDPHVVSHGTLRGHRVVYVSFMDPTTPAWFRLAVDERTARTYAMDMIAPAHFMREDYLRFDRPVSITPPAK